MSGASRWAEREGSSRVEEVVSRNSVSWLRLEPDDRACGRLPGACGLRVRALLRPHPAEINRPGRTVGDFWPATIYIDWSALRALRRSSGSRLNRIKLLEVGMGYAAALTEGAFDLWMEGGATPR